MLVMRVMRVTPGRVAPEGLDRLVVALDVVIRVIQALKVTSVVRDRPLRDYRRLFPAGLGVMREMVEMQGQMEIQALHQQRVTREEAGEEREGSLLPE